MKASSQDIFLIQIQFIFDEYSEKINNLLENRLIERTEYLNQNEENDSLKKTEDLKQDEIKNNEKESLKNTKHSEQNAIENYESNQIKNTENSEQNENDENKSKQKSEKSKENKNEEPNKIGFNDKNNANETKNQSEIVDEDEENDNCVIIKTKKSNEIACDYHDIMSAEIKSLLSPKMQANKQEKKLIKNLQKKSDFTTKLYKLFYYNEREKKWEFDSQSFHEFSVAKQINVGNSLTPLVFFANSKE
ncbi:hypothetical protein M9Y10_035921 [Tritrichomonas musculus]|uniref:Uncharacterized protein n=1 Tax=Tritrichomonas musculus TaxID=1915356 RepID=A0ABR2GX62_9EUKA